MLKGMKSGIVKFCLNKEMMVEMGSKIYGMYINVDLYVFEWCEC